MGASKVREVTVKWVSDQASLRQLNQDLDMLEHRLARIGGTASGPFTPQPGSQQRGAGFAPPSNNGIGGGSQPTLGNRVGILPQTGSGSTQQGPVNTLAVTATNVAIQATNVVITGGTVTGGGGGGGTGGTGMNPQQFMAAIAAFMQGGQGGGGGGNSSILQNFRLGTVLGGGGNFGSAVFGNLLNSILPLAPTAIPLALLHGGLSAFQSQIGANVAYQTTLGAANVAIAAGSRPENAMGSKLQIERERTENAWKTSVLQNPIFNAATFGFSGLDAQLAEQYRQQQAQLYEESEIFSARVGAAKLGLGSHGMIKRLGGLAMGGSRSERALGAYQTTQASSIFGGFNDLLDDPLFKKLVGSYGGTASSTDASLLPILHAVMSGSPGQFPDLLKMMRGGDLGGMFGRLGNTGMTSAFRGDVSGVMSLAPALVASGGVGSLNRILDVLQESLTVQKDQRMVMAAISLKDTGVSSTELGVRKALYGGASPNEGMRGGVRSILGDKFNDLKSRRSLAEKRLAQAKMTGDPELIRQAEVELAEAGVAIQQNSLAKTESYRQDAFETYAFRQSKIGYNSALAEQGIGRESRVGDYQSLAGAERERLGIIDQQIEAERRKLDLSQKSALTLQEQYEINTRLVQLQAQRANMEFDINQREFQGGLSLGRTRVAASSTRMGIRYLVGGSLEGLNDLSSAQSGRRGNLQAILQRIESLRGMGVPESNPELAGLLSEAESARGEITTGFGTPYRASYGLRAEGRRVDTYSQILSRTFAGQGDVRGSYYGQLNLASKELNEIESKYQREMRMARTDDERKRIQEQYEIDKQNVVLGRALPAQQALEQGWQERLISSVYGQSSSFNMVASGFTQREAGLFGGIYNRAFGGSKEQMEYARRQGSLWYGSLMGVQTPEGFTNSGMGGGQGAVPVEFTGPLEVDVTIRDANGDVRETQRTQATVQQQLREQVRNIPTGFFSG